jgi:protoheme IX farnesyltransferase
MSISVPTSHHSSVTPTAGDRRDVSWRELAGAYYNLTKPRIVLELLITTLAALLIAARQYPLPPALFARVLLATLLGGALASGGAAALNCYIDRDIDAVMNRTRRRALPAGILQPRQVLVFGIGLSALAVAILILWVNPLAAALALVGNLYYVVVYTMWLKRSTSQNIVIGGAAGAVPPLVGWAAVTGSLALPALLLFAIIFLWTPAHFWALALLNRKDYAAVKVPMLPAVAGEQYTKWRILAYTVAVVAATLALYLIHAMGLLYLVVASGLGAGFIYMAVALLREHGARRARRTFMYSNIYLALLFFAMVADRIAPLH